MTPEALAAIFGAGLSLSMSIIPGLKQMFERLSPEAKQLTMAGLLALTALGFTFWNCAGGDAGVGICMAGADWKSVIQTYIFALMGMVATYKSTDHLLNKVDDTTGGEKSKPTSNVVHSKLQDPL